MSSLFIFFVEFMISVLFSLAIVFTCVPLSKPFKYALDSLVRGYFFIFRLGIVLYVVVLLHSGSPQTYKSVRTL